MDEFSEQLNKLVLTDEVKVQLRNEQTRLIKIIEAFMGLDKNKDWQILQELVFNLSVANIERQIYNVSLSREIDDKELYRLQGQLAWAKQYNDTGRFVEALKKQLEEIKRKLK
jgi:hypothetical protein